MNIGNVTIDPPVALAPMAGYTDSAFRTLCMKFGCGLVLTEVVNAAAMVHGSKRTMHYLETVPGERPIGANVYGSDPTIMAEAATIIESLGRFDFIDLNCGCPVRKIMSKGAGAALMRFPDRIHEIVKAMAQAVSIPITVKTRIGLTPDAANISEISHAIEDAGASAIFIHARPASNRHSGPANWQCLAHVKAELSIPVVGNGGIDNASAAVAMFSETGVDGVMIGRAAIGNPWIFQEINGLLADTPQPQHSLVEHKAVIKEHLEALMALTAKEKKRRRRAGHSTEQAAVMHFRAHLVKYVSGLDGAGRIRQRLNDMRSLEDVMKAVEGIEM